MEKIVKHELPETDSVYVREHLDDTNVLCAALLETCNSQPGNVFTFAPASTSKDRLAEFKRGGLLRENLPNAPTMSLSDGSRLMPKFSLIEEQSKLLRETLNSVRGSVCIVDDYNPRWSDHPWPLGPKAFGVDEEVYHLLNHEDDDEAFAYAIRQGNNIWHGVTAVCRIAPMLNDARESAPSELRRSAASALLITCSAYDGEGFVAWRSTSA